MNIVAKVGLVAIILGSVSSCLAWVVMKTVDMLLFLIFDLN